MIAACVLAALLMQSQPPTRDARPLPSAGTATVSGVVLAADAQARPLRRARVSINGTALASGRSTITADDGTFAFGGLAAGRYSLAAAKNGYVPTSAGVTQSGPSVTRVRVAEAETQKVTVRLPRGAVITGVVVDNDGQPASGMTVSALRRRYVGTQGEQRFLTAGMLSASDDRGVFRIYGLPEGEYVIAVQPQQRQSGPGAEIRTIARGVISEKGVILSQVFHPGATDVGHAARVTVRAGEERSGIDVQLQYVPVASISGTVALVAGWNVTTIRLIRTDEVPGFDPERRARADAEGRFTFSGVTPGQYRVFAQAFPTVPAGGPATPPETSHAGSTDVAVNGEDVTNVSLTLQPSLTIAGRVAFEGEKPAPAVPEVRVRMPMTLTLGTSGLAIPALRVDSAGTFRVEGVLPGVYRMVGNIQGVRAPIGAWWLKSLVVGGRDVLDAPLDLRHSVEDAVITFSDRASEIAGTVKDAQGGPAPDAYTVVFSADRAGWFFNSRRVAAVRPGRDGLFSIRNLPPGEYRIVATNDLDQGEWFDPVMLERLLPSAAAVRVSGTEKTIHDLVVR